jgi:hypothetical protein
MLAMAALMVFVLGLGLAGASARADSQDERRVRTGARVFRTLLLADIALERKAASDGTLDIAIYAGDAAGVDELAPLIVAAGNTRAPPIALRRVEHLAEDMRPPIGLFLATPLIGAELDRVIAWSIRHGVILYSPFEGDVERGATAGLSIEAKVLPFVNQRTLDASGVELKPFFLKVAKVHR